MNLINSSLNDFDNSLGRSVRLTFIVSIVLHAAILLITLPALIPEKQTSESNEPIEIADYRSLTPQVNPQTVPSAPTLPVPKIKSRESQIAETEDASNRKIDPNAKYLGEHNQSVEKETRAGRIDDFRAKAGTGAKGIPTQIEAIPPTAEEMGTSSESTLSELGETGESASSTKKGIKRNWKTLSLKDLSVGGDGGAEAATDDKLNVERGSRTLLSTREYKFFGYYQRIKELLRQYWKPNIEHQMARLWGKGRQIREDEITTKVLVLLDEKGNISKISKLASSGYMELDEAAITAFQTAAPFPNPPKAMLDDDGFVRINWDFILTTDNSPRIQFRNVGSVPPGY